MNLGSLWSSLIDFLSRIVIPDWGSVIGMIPLLLIPLVVLFLLGVLTFWGWHAIRRPRARTRVVEGPYAPELGADGNPVYPRGLPHCRHDELVYPAGTTRCEQCHNELSVDCPMCGVPRSAGIDTCGNCGLVLQIRPRTRFAKPAGPPPGGAAIA